MGVWVGAKEQKVQPVTENTHFTVPHPVEGGLVYNEGHVCETLLLLAATGVTARCQISGGITNGVNYNIFWCMGKFRHWPGVMTIPQEVLRKSVRLMCQCCLWVSAIKSIRNSRGGGGLPPPSHLNTWHALVLRWLFLFYRYVFVLCVWCYATCRKGGNSWVAGEHPGHERRQQGMSERSLRRQICVVHFQYMSGHAPRTHTQQHSHTHTHTHTRMLKPGCWHE